jgi:hypothetical protein
MKITRHTDTYDAEYVNRLAAEYVKAKEFAESATKRAEELKQQLSKLTDTYGQVDEKGNRWISVDGFSLKRERRVSRNLDAAQAEKWAKSLGLWENISVTVQQVSEDKLMQLAWESAEYSEDISKLYSERVVWAFKASEEKAASND